MLKRLETFLTELAYRRAFRALRRFRGAWFLCELLRKRLEAQLITPSEVLNIVRSWKSSRN